MTEDQKAKCHTIIHSHAVAAAAGNVAPLPGLGVAVDTVAMTTMCIALSRVFGGGISENVAKGMAVNALKQQLLKQPIKTIAKELSKLIPGLGQIVAPSMSIAMLESAGWMLAEELDAKYSQQR